MDEGRRLTLDFVQVDAFASRPFEGNPAAVVPLESWLPDATMLAIAMENNLSETAFTIPSVHPDADYDLRWFTPTMEMPLCGHATLASGHALIGERDIVRFSTKAGILSVAKADGGMLSMDLPASRIEARDLPQVRDALGLIGDVETFVGQGAGRTYIALLEDEAAVRAVAPDFRKVAALDGLAVVTAPGKDCDFASRVFASYHGIDEDPVTGGAHTALCPFWTARLGRSRLTAFQASARGGGMVCEQAGDRVRMTANCVTVIEGRLHLGPTN